MPFLCQVPFRIASGIACMSQTLVPAISKASCSLLMYTGSNGANCRGSADDVSIGTTMSAVGTFRTCPTSAMMSGHGDREDMIWDTQPSGSPARRMP